ncbi:MAG: hypothetical protein ABW352_10155 [Polyangiales bacterium]
MLCHQHPADSAHAACQRCQRGLCRSCAKQFLQRLCTHCIEQSASKRVREARRTLWLALPVFALAAWGVAAASPTLAPRVKLTLSMLAGMLALGSWFGLRRWRRAPALAGGIAALPESETPLLERVLKPALAGLVVWPWLLVETLRDMQLANRLRAFVPAENREATFGFGEASLAFASVAAAFTLGAHGLSSYFSLARGETARFDTPVAGEVGSTEANLAAGAQPALRAKVTPSEPVGAIAPVREPEQQPASEPPTLGPPALPEVTPEVAAPADAPRRARRERRKHGEPAEEQAEQAEPEAEPQTAKREEPEEPEPEQAPPEPAPPPPVLDRRYVPGSEMAKQALSGSRAPGGSYVTSSGRVVIKAPPPTPK